MGQIIADAKKRIQDIRKKDLEVVVLKDGRPVPDASVQLSMKNHQFLFGSNGLAVNTYDTPEKNKTYSNLFTGLLNYTTLPFFWGRYEPKPGQLDQEYPEMLVSWCKQNNLKCKGAPLVWHELVPDWVTYDDNFENLLRKRLHGIMEAFGDTVDFWDLFNEITVTEWFDNAVTHWVQKKGKADAVKFAMDCVREVAPRANLLYNDFYVEPIDMESLLLQFRKKDMPFAAIGLQSHMHQTRWTPRWTLEQTWDICQRYEKYGWPLHFSEVSIVSGKPDGEIHYELDAVNKWIVNPGDEDDQAAYASDFYTLLFSHPAVEAITWWDMADGEWLQAPSGIVSADLKVKPVYHALMNLIKGEWWSNCEQRTNIEGVASANLFCGTYDATVQAAGKTVKVEFDLHRERNTHASQKLVISL